VGVKRQERYLKFDESLELQLLSLGHTDDLFNLVDANRDHLREWLPWLDANASPKETETFIQSTISQYENGQGPQCAVFYNAVMCGVCGFHPIDVRNKSGSLGYWLSNTCLGKGIMTMSVKTIVKTGFMEYGLNRVEIACATGNLKSRAIPERLGFVFEGTLRERELLCGKYVDHAIYSLLASEFALNKALHRTSQ
jgi:ribosomal-protein-serine acetyltransferase